jgi:hypothetical protein
MYSYFHDPGRCLYHEILSFNLVNPINSSIFARTKLSGRLAQSRKTLSAKGG